MQPIMKYDYTQSSLTKELIEWSVVSQPLLHCCHSCIFSSMCSLLRERRPGTVARYMFN